MSASSVQLVSCHIFQAQLSNVKAQDDGATPGIDGTSSPNLAMASNLVVSLLLVVRPGATSSVLAPSSDALCS